MALSCERARWLIEDRIGPCREWPLPYVASLYAARKPVRRTERLRLVLFLYGNGCDPDHIRAAMRPHLRDKAAERDVCSLLEGCLGGRFDGYTYHNVAENDWHFVNGGVDLGRHPPSPAARHLNVQSDDMWETFKRRGDWKCA